MLSRDVDYSVPPTPHYILRGHPHSITQLYFSQTRPCLLYSGDSSGVVALWDLRTYRPLVVWKPHQDGILSLEQLGHSHLVTHARDNKLYLFQIDELLNLDNPSKSFDSNRFPQVEPIFQIDVNALNFCRLSLLDLSIPANKVGEGLIALPSLTKDDHIDIFHVSSKDRLHRSIGISQLLIGSTDQQKTGSVMAVQLLYLPSSSSTSSSPSAADPNQCSSTRPSSQERKKTLHLLIGYESGQLALLEFTLTENYTTSSSPSTSASTTSGDPNDDPEREIAFPIKGRMIQENEGWTLVWVEKCHRDAKSLVMSIRVSSNQKFVYTVGADHFLVKYRLWDLNDEESALPRTFVESTDSPGKSTIKSRPRSRPSPTTEQRKKKKKNSDAAILAVGGWNGEVRIYSSKTLEPLASLDHHRNSVQALDFAPIEYPSFSSSGDEEVDSEEEESQGEEVKESGRGMLATGGMDTKICLWKVYPP